MRQLIENKAGFKKKACENFEYFVSYQGASFGGSFDLGPDDVIGSYENKGTIDTKISITQ